jgi:hypothetical protein
MHSHLHEEGERTKAEKINASSRSLSKLKMLARILLALCCIAACKGKYFIQI